jgi:hypothetical protein
MNANIQFPQYGNITPAYRGPDFLRKSVFAQIALFGCTFLGPNRRRKPLLQSRPGPNLPVSAAPKTVGVCPDHSTNDMFIKDLYRNPCDPSLRIPPHQPRIDPQ